MFNSFGLWITGFADKLMEVLEYGMESVHIFIRLEAVPSFSQQLTLQLVSADTEIGIHRTSSSFNFVKAMQARHCKRQIKIGAGPDAGSDPRNDDSES